MPHIERSIFPWNWAYYPFERNDAASPWLEAFQNAFHWIETYNAKICDFKTFCCSNHNFFDLIC